MSEALKAKLWSIFKGALIAAGGAALYYLARYLATPEAAFDLGPMWVALLSVLVNALRKMLEGDGGDGGDDAIDSTKPPFRPTLLS